MGNAFARNLLAWDGSLKPTGVVNFPREQAGPAPVFFRTDAELTQDGKNVTRSEYLLFSPAPVPSRRVINRVSAEPEPCWYGTAQLGLEKGRPWSSMKVLACGPWGVGGHGSLGRVSQAGLDSRRWRWQRLPGLGQRPM